MEAKVTIVNGKKRITLIRRATGESVAKEVVLKIMGPGYKFAEEKQ